MTSSLVTIAGAMSKELVQFLSSDHSLSKVLLVDSLKFNLLAVTQLVILDISVVSIKMMW